MLGNVSPFNFDKKKLFNVKVDRLLQHNLIGKLPKQEATMDSMLKANIQQYNNRMLDNKFVID